MFTKLRSTISKVVLISSGVLALLLPGADRSPAQETVVYDLRSDWSETSNPNGPWAFRKHETPLSFVPDWRSWSTGTTQPAWATGAMSSGSFSPAFFRATEDQPNGLTQIRLGDIVMLTFDPINGPGTHEGNVIWFSPGDGTIDIEGHIWHAGLESGNLNDWLIRFNNMFVTEGQVGTGDPYDRDNPFEFADGSAGGSVLQNISVSEGDHVQLIIQRVFRTGDYAGFNLTIKFTGAAPPNTPPTAIAGMDKSIRAGDIVQLDGSASFDDNTASGALLYSWSFSSLPAGSSAVLTGADTATPSFEADVADTYGVELIVTDEGGLFSVADEVIISSDNLAPTAVATVDFSLAVINTTAYFDGSESTDPEMDPLTYSWSITAAPVGSTAVLVGADTVSPTLIPDVEGVYEVTLNVSDFIGFGTPATVEITATNATDYAEILILEACDRANGLIAGQVTTKGNQNAFCKHLNNAIRDLQKGEVADAIDTLNKAIERTDGCVLRGGPDGNGPGRDWIVDCDAQLAIYDLLTLAVGALDN